MKIARLFSGEYPGVIVASVPRAAATGMFRHLLLGGDNDRMRQAVEDEVVERAVPAGDTAYIFLALWGVTDAGAGRYACGVLKA
jgi:hypothetical protein